MRRFITLAFVLITACTLIAQDTNSIAFRRAAHLRRGINTSQWFAQSWNNRYPAEKLATYTDASDLALIKQMGFDHIRLSIDPEPLVPAFTGRQNSQSEFLAALDKTVQAAQANGLAVIIDVHPESNYKRRVREEGGFLDKFTDLWRALAAHYQSYNPELTYFEVMNEPENNDANQWAGMQARVVKAIRTVAPQNTIIVSGARWSDIRELLQIEAVADANVIYNFHFYTPHYFTHQGATWSSNLAMHLTKGVHYPSKPEDAAALRDQVPDMVDKYDITSYAFDNWNAARINAEIEIAAQWAKERHVPLTCNEFGVFRSYTNPAERMAWIRDVRTALEKNGIGWTMWDYRGGFGVVTKQDSQAAVPDRDVLKALGLEK